MFVKSSEKLRDMQKEKEEEKKKESGIVLPFRSV